MRPTNRKFTRPSSRIAFERRARGPAASRASVSTASGSTPVGAKPSASSSCRLYSEIAEREVDAARPASPVRARASEARRKSAGSYGAKKCAGVTLWYCSTRPPASARERLGHRRRQRVVEDRQVARPRGRSRRTAARRPAGRRRSSGRRARTRGPSARSIARMRGRCRRSRRPCGRPAPTG